MPSIRVTQSWQVVRVTKWELGEVVSVFRRTTLKETTDLGQGQGVFGGHRLTQQMGLTHWQMAGLQVSIPGLFFSETRWVWIQGKQLMTRVPVIRPKLSSENYKSGQLVSPQWVSCLNICLNLVVIFIKVILYITLVKCVSFEGLPSSVSQYFTLCLLTRSICAKNSW